MKQHKVSLVFEDQPDGAVLLSAFADPRAEKGELVEDASMAFQIAHAALDGLRIMQRITGMPKPVKGDIRL